MENKLGHPIVTRMTSQQDHPFQDPTVTYSVDGSVNEIYAVVSETRDPDTKIYTTELLQCYILRFMTEEELAAEVAWLEAQAKGERAKEAQEEGK